MKDFLYILTRIYKTCVLFDTLLYGDEEWFRIVDNHWSQWDIPEYLLSFQPNPLSLLNRKLALLGIGYLLLHWIEDFSCHDSF